MKELQFCPIGERQLPAYLENRLSASERTGFEAHAASCAICRGEIEMWKQLSELPTPAASARFQRDFDAMLARQTQIPVPRRTPWYAFAAAAAAIAAVAFGAGFWASSTRQQPEIAELRHELRNVRGMVAMGLLQQQSAVDRLRGVNYSVRLEDPDEDVVGALVQTLRGDSSVDVRLAATDALRKYSDRARVRQSMIEALQQQDSPLVQLALIDTIVEIRERRAAKAFSALASHQDVDPTVKSRLERALEELKEQKIQ